MVFLHVHKHVTWEFLKIILYFYEVIQKCYFVCSDNSKLLQYWIYKTFLNYYLYLPRSGSHMSQSVSSINWIKCWILLTKLDKVTVLIVQVLCLKETFCSMDLSCMTVIKRNGDPGVFQNFTHEGNWNKLCSYLQELKSYFNWESYSEYSHLAIMFWVHRAACYVLHVH